MIKSFKDEETAKLFRRQFSRKLPQDIQHVLFERAVLLGHKTEQDESLREQLAQFLHAHHERTTAR